MFSEIVLGCRFDSVRAVSEINLVEVEVENFLLRKGLLHPIGQNGFPNLSRPLPLGGEQQRPCHLLCNGAPSLHNFPGHDIFPEGSEDCGVIESFVLEETGILRRNKGMQDETRDLLDGHDHAFFLKELPDEFPRFGINIADNGRVVISQGLDARKTVGEVEVCSSGGDAENDEERRQGNENELEKPSFLPTSHDY